MPKNFYVIAFSSNGSRLFGAIFSKNTIEGTTSALIKKDGMDATDRICSAILESDFYDKMSTVLLDRVIFGDSNVADIKAIRKNTGLDVILILQKKPNIKALMSLLRKHENYKERLQALSNAGNIYTYGPIFYQKEGLGIKECETAIKALCISSNIPEPLRVADVMALGLGNI